MNKGTSPGLRAGCTAVTYRSRKSGVWGPFQERVLGSYCWVKQTNKQASRLGTWLGEAAQIFVFGGLLSLRQAEQFSSLVTCLIRVEEGEVFSQLRRSI